jgi:transcriptional regulator with XRE-family HTH domain
MRQIPESTTKKDFAELAGISRPTLDRWLKGYTVLEITERSIRQTINQIENSRAVATA